MSKYKNNASPEKDVRQTGIFGKPAGGKAFDQITTVDINLIDENRYNEGISQDDIEELVESIRDVGLLQPILVIRVGNRFRVLSGHRRLHACKLIHESDLNAFTQMPVIISNYEQIKLPLSGKGKEKYIVATSIIEQRGKLSMGDVLIASRLMNDVYDELEAAGIKYSGRRRDRIAEDLGVSTWKVGKADVLRKNIIPEVLPYVERDKISASGAGVIALMSAKEQQAIMQKSKEDEVPELSALAEAILARKKQLEDAKKRRAHRKLEKAIISTDALDELLQRTEDLNRRFKKFDNDSYSPVLRAKISKAINAVNKNIKIIELTLIPEE